MPRPNVIMSRCPNSIRVPGDAIRRRPVGVCRILHHRTPVLLPLEMHKLGVRVFLSTPRRRQQIHEESEDIESEKEGDDPFENGRYVLLVVEGGGCEDDSADNLHNDKEKFIPKGEAQYAVLAEVHAEALVLGADEDGANDVTRHKQEEEAIV